MGVIKTDQWLHDLYDKPILICAKLEEYFPGGTADDIFSYLVRNGMYRSPSKDKKKFIEYLQKKNFWEVTSREFDLLRAKWQGPDIPIFIFPSDSNNRKLSKDFNGKSGVAFTDKLFLFISEKTTENELKALFTHEYNHVCRLKHHAKDSSKYNLLDAIILEGLAEYMVGEQLGEALQANWTTYYPAAQIKKWIDHIIIPNSKLTPNNRKYEAILYGRNLYPKMLGYCAGYQLVEAFTKKSKVKGKDLLKLDSETFL
ncbi:Zn-dependent protease [Oceanobacillus piezotolerans]|uniref:Zn-dependent protease n=1 Tax=Oceanobacillus piezotolerans TaxID=2448030 RepID=A0A498D8G2_9BACI|nr:DUF2268 domain-containing putative Zn-dependent protease [Oceanobacillus piezotolerans]RLL45127.1 Zn-dependent protease [Oceanobacillus piezotolerans]